MSSSENVFSSRMTSLLNFYHQQELSGDAVQLQWRDFKCFFRALRSLFGSCDTLDLLSWLFLLSLKHDGHRRSNQLANITSPAKSGKCSFIYSHSTFLRREHTNKVHCEWQEELVSNLRNRAWALFFPRLIHLLISPSVFSCSCCLLQIQISYYCLNCEAVNDFSSHPLSIN